MSDQAINNELDHVLDFYSIVLDRDAIKRDIMDLIEKEKHKAYSDGVDSVRYSPDYSGTIGGSSLSDWDRKGFNNG